MDDFEKRVLRQRKNTLADHITVNLDLLNSFRAQRIITEDMTEIIMAEKTNAARVHKLLEFLMFCPRLTTFDDMCAALMTCPGDLSWLAKELQTDVRADRGNLVIDYDVMKEAAMLTHRKFGTSKRFSELDKKDMTELIAIKIQVSKEEWKQELDLVKERLEDQKRAVKSRDNQSRHIREEMVDFIKANEHGLLSQAHGMVTTSEVLRTSVADDDLMAMLNQTTRFILGRVRSVLKDKEILAHEREKCLEIIGAKGAEKEKPLDQMLLIKLEQLPKIQEQHRAELAKKDQALERQRTMIRELELELQEKEEEINKLKEQVAQKTGEIGALQGKVMQNECSTIHQEDSMYDSSGSGDIKTNGKAKRKGTPKKKISTASK